MRLFRGRRRLALAVALSVLSVFGTSALAATCGGWDTSARARMDCCKAAGHDCGESAADDCCAAGEQGQNAQTSAAAVLTPEWGVLSPAPDPRDLFTWSAAPAAAVLQHPRVATYLRVSAFLI